MTPVPRRVAALASGLALLIAACSGGGPSVDAFCREVADLLQTDALNFDASAVDDPAVRSGLAQTASQFETVVSVSPEEVRDSAEVLAGLTRALAEAVADSNARDPFERSEAILAAQQLYAEDLPDAVDEYNAYVTQHCAPAPGG